MVPFAMRLHYSSIFTQPMPESHNCSKSLKLKLRGRKSLGSLFEVVLKMYLSLTLPWSLYLSLTLSFLVSSCLLITSFLKVISELISFCHCPCPCSFICLCLCHCLFFFRSCLLITMIKSLGSLFEDVICHCLGLLICLCICLCHVFCSGHVSSSL